MQRVHGRLLLRVEAQLAASQPPPFPDTQLLLHACMHAAKRVRGALQRQPDWMDGCMCGAARSGAHGPSAASPVDCCELSVP